MSQGRLGHPPAGEPDPEAREPWILPNEASWDRAGRIAAAVLILGLGWANLLPGLWGAAARIFGVVPLVTGLLGWSPLYAILGYSTLEPHASRNEKTTEPPVTR